MSYLTVAMAGRLTERIQRMLVMVTGAQEVLSAVEEHIKVSLATLRAPCFIPPDS